MAADNWKKSYAVIRKYEGGKVNDPDDPGGRTNAGITQRVYDAYRRLKGQAQQSVYQATEKEIEAIYKVQYWAAARCDDMPAGIDLCVFDTSVNSGIKRAAKLLQASLIARQKASGSGANARLRVDGQIGMATLAALDNDLDNDLLIAEFGRRRQGFYRGLKTFRKFGKGWTKRNANCVKIAQAWATGSVGPDPVPAYSQAQGGAPKAYDEKIKEGVGPVTATPASGGAVTVAGGTLDGGTSLWISDLQAQAAQAQEAVSPLVDYLEALRWVWIGLMVLGALITVYGGYWTWKNRRIRDAEVAADFDPDADVDDAAVHSA